MSIVKYTALRNAPAKIEYCIYGKSGSQMKNDNLKYHTNRLSSFSSTTTVKSFIRDCMKLKSMGRDVQAIEMVQSFKNSDDNLSYRSKSDADYVNYLGTELAHKLYPNTRNFVFTHGDGSNHNLHNHIIVLNKQFESWKAIKENRSLQAMRAANDELMEENGMTTLKHPALQETFETQRNREKHGDEWVEKYDFDYKMGSKLKNAYDSKPQSFSEFEEKLKSDGIEIVKRYDDKDESLVRGLIFKMDDEGTNKFKKKHRKRRRKASKFGIRYLYQNLVKTFQKNVELAKQAKMEKTRKKIAEKQKLAEIERRKDAERRILETKRTEKPVNSPTKSPENTKTVAKATKKAVKSTYKTASVGSTTKRENSTHDARKTQTVTPSEPQEPQKRVAEVTNNSQKEAKKTQVRDNQTQNMAKKSQNTVKKTIQTAKKASFRQNVEEKPKESIFNPLDIGAIDPRLARNNALKEEEDENQFGE